MRNSYRLRVLVADETPVQFRARNFELPVEIIGGFLVGVGNLPENAFVIVDHFGARKLRSVKGHL